jgi:hypothetical protein
MHGRHGPRPTLALADRREEDRTSMLRPTAREAQIGAPPAAGAGRPDRAMEVLQYGTAILVIIVVTLLGAMR